MVWYRVRVSESQRYTPTQKYTEYPLGHTWIAWNRPETRKIQHLLKEKKWRVKLCRDPPLSNTAMLFSFVFLCPTPVERGGGRGEWGGGGEPIYKWRGCSSYLLGVKSFRLVPLRSWNKSKMTTVRIIAVPFRVLNRRKNNRNYLSVKGEINEKFYIFLSV